MCGTELILQILNRLRCRSITYQSIENAGVAFVKGADERKKFFEKKKNDQ